MRTNIKLAGTKRSSFLKQRKGGINNLYVIDTGAYFKYILEA
jgi:hypothetical protein